MNELIRHGGQGLRRHARQVWESRGGGFYGFVAMLTFLYLESLNLLGDVAALPHFRPTIGGVIGWVVQNMVAALLNFLWSVVWPVAWINRFGVNAMSAAFLVGCYATYRLIRPSILRLLQEPGEVVEAAPERPAVKRG